MTDSLLHRYKEALKAGHVAVLQERPEEALEHYREAAELAPERALPHSSQAQVSMRLGRVEDALDGFRTAASLAPRDETVLVSFLEALRSAPHAADTPNASGRAADVAETLDRLAALQLDQGRDGEALAALHSANEASPTELRAARAATLAATIARGEHLGLDAIDEEIREAAAREPEALLAAAEEALAAGETETALHRYIAAAEGYRDRGAHDAALDACARALMRSPADATLQIRLATLYLDRGWRERAVEKLALLERLLSLDSTSGPGQLIGSASTPDEAAASRAAASRVELQRLVQARLPDERRLESAGPGATSA